MPIEGLGDNTLAEDASKPPCYRRVFLVGSPRSGTTWLQLLLAQHPGVATSRETHLFTQYLSRLEERWTQERERAAAGFRVSGLSRVVSDEEFYLLFRAFAANVFEFIRKSNPDAAVVVEKSPDHARFGGMILKVFPDAWFLHIIRDPRSVANSFRHAAATWWRGAPSGPIESTRRWRLNVERGREISQLTPRYYEVRYEDLLADGTAELEGVFRWLELPASRSLCKEAVEACAIDRLKDGFDRAVRSPSLAKEPDGFFRKGSAEAWRTEMSSADLKIVEYLAGDLMEELGYRPEARRATGRRPLRLVLHAILERLLAGWRRVGDGVEWRLRALIQRL